MFYGLENTQKEVAEQLELLLKENRIPSAMLFTGPDCSSKMFASLCCCKAYGSDTDSTVIISDRNYKFRIKAALELVKKNRNKASKDFLTDTVSVFLKQYHGALLDSQSSANRKKFSDAGSCSEILDEIKDAEDSEIVSVCEKLEKAISPLIDMNKSSSISVNQIRAIRDWSMETSIQDKPKFVIIEGLENSNDNASNALLKILEEPPKNTFFILISVNSGKIPATILSRVRKFVFNPFSDVEKKYVLNKLFVNPTEYEDLESFFIQLSGIDDKFLNLCAFNLINKQNFDLLKLVRLLEETSSWDRFFHLVIKELRIRALQNVDKRRYEFLLNEINTMVNKGKLFNQTKRMIFDFIIYRTDEVLK